MCVSVGLIIWGIRFRATEIEERERERDTERERYRERYRERDTEREIQRDVHTYVCIFTRFSR